MLKNLNIKNYAIIDNLDIDFNDGFNVFTGETGAGKSIIVGALTFLLRGRSDASIIKTGKDKAIIEGVFSVDDDELIKKLKEQDIECDNNEIIVKRTISKDNHNSIKINQSNVTLNFLTELFSNYCDIHSQKDNQFLYNNKNQLLLLDNFANNDDLLNEYSLKYNDYLNKKKEYEDILENQYNEKEIDFIKFNYKELEDANLSENEENDLKESEESYKSVEKYAELLNNIDQIYDGDDGLKEKFYNLKNCLQIDNEKIKEISTIINDIYYNLEDNITNLKKYLNIYLNKEINIDEIEERLYVYSKLKRKYKLETVDLIKYKEQLKEKIEAFENKEQYLEGKKKALEASYQSCDKLADELTKKRKNASKTLIKEVEIQAKELMLNNFSFNIDFSGNELSLSGKDNIEFMISLNKGESMKPLKNIASGGEISRIMLALKVVFAKLSKTKLLILDEIDTGVSGMVAHSVGKKIAAIANDIQVLCITHLAPVAACADNHYLIYKCDTKDSTITNLRELNKDEIIEQLAIISNTSTDKAALEAAKQLYESSQREINENK